jgi:hypothetical protein
MDGVGWRATRAASGHDKEQQHTSGHVRSLSLKGYRTFCTVFPILPPPEGKINYRIQGSG